MPPSQSNSLQALARDDLTLPLVEEQEVSFLFVSLLEAPRRRCQSRLTQASLLFSSLLEQRLMAAAQVSTALWTLVLAALAAICNSSLP